MPKTFGFPGENAVRERNARVALSAVLANAIAFAWQNPEDRPILVGRVSVDITTPGLATGLMDIGIVASAAATADNLLDGVAVSAAGVFNNISDVGTNGKARGKMAAKGGALAYITGKQLTAAGTGLVGFVYISYVVVED